MRRSVSRSRMGYSLGRYPERKHALICGKMENTSVSLMGYFFWILVWRSKMASRLLSPWEKRYCIFESVLTCFNMAVCLGFVLWLFLWVRGYAIWLALSMASDSIFQHLWQKRKKSEEKGGKGRKREEKGGKGKGKNLRCRDGVCKVIKVEMPWWCLLKLEMPWWCLLKLEMPWCCLQSYQSWDAVMVST